MKNIRKIIILVFIIQILVNIDGSKLKSRLKLKTNLKLASIENCSPLCLECSENDYRLCNVCKTGIFQYNNICHNNCPIGTYADNEWQVCRECDKSCPTCWGPMSDMCGSQIGTKTSVVLLENEIKKYFITKPFNNEEVSAWLMNLNSIMKKLPIKAEALPLDIDLDTLSPEDVYHSQKIEVELPIGSFSRNNGMFIPVPSYLNDNLDLINSHWIFVEGMWDGHKINLEWFPLLPTFIKNLGEKNKIYFENGGNWVYEKSKRILIYFYLF